MARQKVKGTGHKQPADAKTEPNFYDMRPADEAAEMAAMHSFQMSMDGSSHHTQLPLSQTSLFQDLTPAMTMMSPAPIPAYNAHNSAVATYSSPAWTFRQPPPLGSVLDSPASPGLHGAAHLLQNIASGYTTANAPLLQMPSVEASLGPPAAADTSSATQIDGSGNDASSMDPPNQRRPATTFLQPRLSSPFDLKKS
jgi:hypothetical protein